MSFLNQLQRVSTAAGLPNEHTVMPAYRPGDYVAKSPILGTLRREQLVHLARAYGIAINPDAPKGGILPAMENAEANGTFNKPPTNPYYFEWAKYTQDEIKAAKTNGGWFKRKLTGHIEQDVFCAVLGQWTGPDPEGDRRPKEYGPGEKMRERQSRNASKNLINPLRAECKRLGINSFGKGRAELARLIAERQGMLPAEEKVA